MELSKRRLWLISGALILSAFLLGLLPKSLENRSLRNELQQRSQQLQQARTEETGALQTQLAASQEKLQLADLKNQLGMLMVNAQEMNFAEARERSTQFFDGLQQLARQTQDTNKRENLTAILNHRDEITADLTAGNPGVAEKLRSLYHQMYQFSAG